MISGVVVYWMMDVRADRLHFYVQSIEFDSHSSEQMRDRLVNSDTK
jgi:hypothetical protein